MRNDTLSIFKKEMDRFLHNKASAAAAIILPGLFIFLLWTIMGNTLRTSANKASCRHPKGEARHMYAF